jgi:hypothetical protein
VEEFSTVLEARDFGAGYTLTYRTPTLSSTRSEYVTLAEAAPSGHGQAGGALISPPKGCILRF